MVTSGSQRTIDDHWSPTVSHGKKKRLLFTTYFIWIVYGELTHFTCEHATDNVRYIKIDWFIGRAIRAQQYPLFPVLHAISDLPVHTRSTIKQSFPWSMYRVVPRIRLCHTKLPGASVHYPPPPLPHHPRILLLLPRRVCITRKTFALFLYCPRPGAYAIIAVHYYKCRCLRNESITLHPDHGSHHAVTAGRRTQAYGPRLTGHETISQTRYYMPMQRSVATLKRRRYVNVTEAIRRVENATHVDIIYVRNR